MAILSKIRERSLFLILVIGLALFAFVLDPSTLSDFFNSSKVNEVGEVNGEGISRQEYAEGVENYRKNTGNRTTEMQAANAVWTNLVRQKLYKNQLENAGITIGEEDVWNEMINSPSINKSPQFQTAGLFDEEKLKQFLATTKENNSDLWNAWSSYMNNIKSNLERRTYDNLVTSGLGASLTEGKSNYFSENSKLNAKVVYVPYSSIPDSLVTVSESEVEKYIKDHKKDYEVEASTDIAFVKFDIKPTKADEEILKAELKGLINDKKEYSAVTKGEITIAGFKNAKDNKAFFTEFVSDTPLNDNYLYKNTVTNAESDNIFAGKEGDVFGPYKEGEFLKLSKITAIATLPDSVKASHILIPFVGSRSANETTTQTQAQAKKTADSLAVIIKRRPRKLADLAKKLSADKSNSEKGGELGWFPYNRMVKEFRDFSFENKKGSVGVVKTIFGFHVIKVDGQKNPQKVVKLATFTKKITPSEKTESDVFQKAETFAQKVADNKSKFYTIAKEDGYKAKPAIGLKIMDENIPSLGNNREIVTWAFNSDNKVGTYKRFDAEESYIVAIITEKHKAGLPKTTKVMARIKPILIKEKKAALLAEKFSNTTLEAIAKDNKTTVRSIVRANLKSPTLSGIGNEPSIVGAMLNATQNKVVKPVDGDRGVFAFVVTAKELPTALPNYDTERSRISEQLKRQSFKFYEAMKNASNVEDNRAFFYGIQ